MQDKSCLSAAVCPEPGKVSFSSLYKSVLTSHWMLISRSAQSAQLTAVALSTCNVGSHSLHHLQRRASVSGSKITIIHRQIADGVYGCCRADGCSPAFLAYGHHPLSTVLHPSIPFWRQIDRSSPETIYGKLSQHGVQVYLNGHLHSAFGQRLHKRHRSFAAGLLCTLCCALP